MGLPREMPRLFFFCGRGSEAPCPAVAGARVAVHALRFTDRLHSRGFFFLGFGFGFFDALEIILLLF